MISETRIAELERRMARVDRLLTRLADFLGIAYPLLMNDATDDQIAAVKEYLNDLTAILLTGATISPDEFAARIYALVPGQRHNPAMPGLVATACFKDIDYRLIYKYLRDAGLPYIDRDVERAEPGWELRFMGR